MNDFNDYSSRIHSNFNIICVCETIISLLMKTKFDTDSKKSISQLLSDQLLKIKIQKIKEKLIFFVCDFLNNQSIYILKKPIALETLVIPILKIADSLSDARY